VCCGFGSGCKGYDCFFGVCNGGFKCVLVALNLKGLVFMYSGFVICRVCVLK